MLGISPVFHGETSTRVRRVAQAEEELERLSAQNAGSRAQQGTLERHLRASLRTPLPPILTGRWAGDGLVYWGTRRPCARSQRCATFGCSVPSVTVPVGSLQRFPAPETSPV